MKTAGSRRGWRIAALGAGLALAGCAGTQDPGSAEVEYRGSDPAQAGVPASRPASGAIVAHEGYYTAVAREGDTVGTLAARVGVDAADLGAYNGRSPTQPLRGGEELVLPPRPEGYRVAAASAAPDPGPSSAPPPAEPAIEAAPLGEEAAAPGAATAPQAAAPPAESGSGWSADLAAAAIERASGEDETDAQESAGLGAPPSAGDPLPPDPEPAPELVSPDLGRFQTGPGAPPPPRATGAEPPGRPAPGAAAAPAPAEDTAAAGERDGDDTLAALPPEPQPAEPGDASAAAPAGEGRFLRPVTGRIALGFGPRPDGGRNEGVDFAAPAGSPVRAADDGEVALVSEALGGLGTIVLLRHPGDLLTVYGRLSDVGVSKGDIVARGQRIGAVAAPAPPAEPRMHFEVREGADAVDPMTYLGG